MFINSIGLQYVTHKYGDFKRLQEFSFVSYEYLIKSILYPNLLEGNKSSHPLFQLFYRKEYLCICPRSYNPQSLA